MAAGVAGGAGGLVRLVAVLTGGWHGGGHSGGGEESDEGGWLHLVGVVERWVVVCLSGVSWIESGSDVAKWVERRRRVRWERWKYL